jgi:hypothetical protein
MRRGQFRNHAPQSNRVSGRIAPVIVSFSLLFVDGREYFVLSNAATLRQDDEVINGYELTRLLHCVLELRAAPVHPVTNIVAPRRTKFALEKLFQIIGCVWFFHFDLV